MTTKELSAYRLRFERAWRRVAADCGSIADVARALNSNSPSVSKYAHRIRQRGVKLPMLKRGPKTKRARK